MKIGITNDHAGPDLKKSLISYLENKGYEIINYGTDLYESCDYPTMAIPLCKAIQNNEVDLGIAICGTGVGISIACNKHKGIRACCCSEASSARLSRQHNNANIVCIGARIVSDELAYDIADAFLTSEFSNGPRHCHRIELIHEIEGNEF